MQPLRSVKQAAELLGISHWTVRAYIRDGKLQTVRLGRRVLLTEEELERLVAENSGIQEAEPEQVCAQGSEVRNGQ
jgi:excisionase family DNA binding protein